MESSNNRLLSLFEKLKNDKMLSQKLDLIEEISSTPSTSKRKVYSPLKTKKVKLSLPPSDPQTGKPHFKAMLMVVTISVPVIGTS